MGVLRNVKMGNRLERSGKQGLQNNRVVEDGFAAAIRFSREPTSRK